MIKRCSSPQKNLYEQSHHNAPRLSGPGREAAMVGGMEADCSGRGPCKALHVHHSTLTLTNSDRQVTSTLWSLFSDLEIEWFGIISKVACNCHALWLWDLVTCRGTPWGPLMIAPKITPKLCFFSGLYPLGLPNLFKHPVWFLFPLWQNKAHWRISIFSFTRSRTAFGLLGDYFQDIPMTSLT